MRDAMVLTPAGLRFQGRVLPCAIGRGGVVRVKREGDMGTPAGTLRVTGLLWRPDRMARPALWARPIGPRDLWCDDPAHPLYNRPARAPLAASAERLRRADPLYDLVLLTDWNADALPGRGSAIFLHRWRRPGHPTEGCIAFAPEDLRWLARHAPPGTPIVVPEALA
ncbi:L,D-transpeptidase [Jannaschia sp. W003]|uniref:L,D-transpeptidase family protein n=1 Tax=Jannaschia sp. W003 TaxID=2867012 RepID=UPI0021A8661D|nr:L,D-transpeptidase family protein [Jannaschia sp. W003]UWQ22125.1 L,D-transpeptidase family protein [Jannaschia sp. W003]